MTQLPLLAPRDAAVSDRSVRCHLVGEGETESVSPSQSDAALVPGQETSGGG
jgi:hypothetical protein